MHVEQVIFRFVKICVHKDNLFRGTWYCSQKPDSWWSSIPQLGTYSQTRGWQGRRFEHGLFRFGTAQGPDSTMLSRIRCVRNRTAPGSIGVARDQLRCRIRTPAPRLRRQTGHLWSSRKLPARLTVLYSFSDLLVKQTTLVVSPTAPQEIKSYMYMHSTNHVYLHRPNAFGFWQTRLHLCYETLKRVSNFSELA